MNLEVVIEEKAIEDIAEAIKWYSEKSLVAEENFKKEITEAFNYLQFTIAEHRKVLADVRVLPLKIFPYNIYYFKKETDNKVFIIAILHNKRENEFIKTRIKILVIKQSIKNYELHRKHNRQANFRQPWKSNN